MTWSLRRSHLLTGTVRGLKRLPNIPAADAHHKQARKKEEKALLWDIMYNFGGSSRRILTTGNVESLAMSMLVGYKHRCDQCTPIPQEQRCCDPRMSGNLIKGESRDRSILLHSLVVVGNQMQVCLTIRTPERSGRGEYSHGMTYFNSGYTSWFAQANL